MVGTIAEPSARLVYPATHADAGIAELAKIIVLMSTSEAFVSIIASVASLNLMKPTEASQRQRPGVKGGV